MPPTPDRTAVRRRTAPSSRSTVRRPFRRLSNVTAGEGPWSKLLVAILRTMPEAEADLDAAFARVGEATVAEVWTVYTWLRGRGTPSLARRSALIRLARERNVDPGRYLPPKVLAAADR